MSLRWRPTPEELLDYEESPWDGFTGLVLRPFEFDGLARVWFATAVLFALAAVAWGVILVVESDLNSTDRWVLGGASALAAITSGVLGGMLAFLSPVSLKRFWGAASMTVYVAAVVVITASLAATGPRNQLAALLYAEGPVFAVYILRPWVAAFVVALSPVAYGGLLIWRANGASPFPSWFMATVAIVGISLLMGGITRRTDRLRASESAARADLTEMNTELERRVRSQVEELERAKELRRFLPASVADVVASGAAEELLAPHRRRIAVLFCDLRGFTAFTNANEPEVVLSVLEEYFRSIGEIFDRHDVTVAQYTGDGVMAFVGDPVEVDNPAVVAATVAIELRDSMVTLTTRWRHHGHELGFGTSISFGYATLGVIGTGAKRDYAPMGPVVNLAARLCAIAEDGQVLTDHATHLALGNEFASRLVGSYELKGFGRATPAYALS